MTKFGPVSGGCLMSSVCIWCYGKTVLKNSRLHSVAEHKIYEKKKRVKKTNMPPKCDTSIKHSLGQLGE